MHPRAVTQRVLKEGKEGAGQERVGVDLIPLDIGYDVCRMLGKKTDRIVEGLPYLLPLRGDNPLIL